MVSHVELFRGNQRLGKYDLPTEVAGQDGRRFRLTYAIRKGGNGVVFEARPLNYTSSLPQKCAVKFLRQQDASRMDRFRNEVRILRELAHPAISQYFDSGELKIDGLAIPWVAMELGGDNLRRVVELTGTLGPPTLLAVLIQMAEALDHLHSKGIIHRDVKPDNFVLHHTQAEAVQMIDFGIAKYATEDVSGRPMDQFTQQQEFVGPVFFSSPELIAYASRKSQLVDHRSDLFQLGMVMWFLATGRIAAGVPARRSSPLGDDFYNLVFSLLSESPEDRPQTAAAVRDELEKLRAITAT
ncbi:MAG: serine/threonine protein kinase [Gemmatimonadota bacterium]|nr:serine/threonine protein kinase [Gemmatimonadota bacterium]